MACEVNPMKHRNFLVSPHGHSDQRARILPEMNSSKEADDMSGQETEFPDSPAKVLHPVRDDDEEESTKKSEPSERREDRKETEIVTKEAMLRFTGGQL